MRRAILLLLTLLPLAAAGCDLGADTRGTMPKKHYDLPERGPVGGREIGSR